MENGKWKNEWKWIRTAEELGIQREMKSKTGYERSGTLAVWQIEQTRAMYSER